MFLLYPDEREKKKKKTKRVKKNGVRLTAVIKKIRNKVTFFYKERKKEGERKQTKKWREWLPNLPRQ